MSELTELIAMPSSPIQASFPLERSHHANRRQRRQAERAEERLAKRQAQTQGRGDRRGAAHRDGPGPGDGSADNGSGDAAGEHFQNFQPVLDHLMNAFPDFNLAEAELLVLSESGSLSLLRQWLVDEMMCFSEKQLSGFILSMHKMHVKMDKKDWPIFSDFLLAALQAFQHDWMTVVLEVETHRDNHPDLNPAVGKPDAPTFNAFLASHGVDLDDASSEGLFGRAIPGSSTDSGGGMNSCGDESDEEEILLDGKPIIGGMYPNIWNSDTADLCVVRVPCSLEIVG